MRAVLCGEDGATQAGARSLFSTVVDWVLRRTRFGARDCLAGADSFALRGFLDMELVEAPPDHSTISRTRRLIDLETHREVFTWILKQLAGVGQREDHWH